MMITRKTLFWTSAVIVLFAVWTAGAFFAGRGSVTVPQPEVTVDTVIVRETIRDTVLIPKEKYITRVETVFVEVPGDTVRIGVDVPIERKVYQTEDYRATVEGYRPLLLDMEIYRQTRYVTRTETVGVPDKRRWGLGVQVGYGYNFDRFYPYVGVGIQYSLITW